VSTAIVSGALANKPWNGGNTWTRLSFVLGLRRLGFEVIFIEQLSKPSEEARRYLGLVCASYGIDGHLLSDGGVPEEVSSRVEDAALLINIGGHLTVEALKRAPHVKVFLDDDPGYTQIWHVSGQLGERLAGHDYYYTVGACVGSPDSEIPTGGIEWRLLWPPVVLSEWPVAGSGTRFTTVGSWRGAYGPVDYAGKWYGQKAHEFRRFLELPRLTAQTFEIALDIHEADSADRDRLTENGWRLVEPRIAAGTPDAFRTYVQGSSAEFSVAQGIHVHTRSGWFSDRTTRYLASGKPALVQETGFRRSLPVGEGLLSFRALDEAARGVARIVDDYEAHCAAARALAERYFDSDLVLGRLLDEVGLG
jgi:hypothetical protein